MRLGLTTITTGEDSYSRFLLTTFSDGSFVIARPLNEPWEKTLTHDWVHTWLWWYLFSEPSYTLWKLAHLEEPRDDNLVAYEEAAVLKICNHLSRMPA